MDDQLDRRLTAMEKTLRQDYRDLGSEISEVKREVAVVNQKFDDHATDEARRDEDMLTEVKCLRTKVIRVDKEAAVNKTKTGFWGAVGGGGVMGLIQGIKYLLNGHG